MCSPVIHGCCSYDGRAGADVLHHQGRTVGWFRCRLGAAKPQIFTIWPFTAKARPPTPGPSEFKLQTHSLTCVPFQISINHANGGRYRDFGLSGLYRASSPLAIPAASQVYLVINLYILSLILVGLASLLFSFLNCFIKCNWNAYRLWPLLFSHRRDLLAPQRLKYYLVFGPNYSRVQHFLLTSAPRGIQIC